MHEEFQRLRREIRSDLGGEERLSALEMKLIDAFASNSVAFDFVSAKILEQAQIHNIKNFVELAASLTNTMLRVAQRLGTKRRPKTAPTLHELPRGARSYAGQFVRT
jgi:hypothetical protein